jgi:hypothetical protein
LKQAEASGMDFSLDWFRHIASTVLLAIAAATPFALIVWLRSGRDIPYWWTLIGIVLGAAIGHFAVPADWGAVMLSRQVVGAGLGGLAFDLAWLALRRTGHAG